MWHTDKMVIYVPYSWLSMFPEKYISDLYNVLVFMMLSDILIWFLSAETMFLCLKSH